MRFSLGRAPRLASPPVAQVSQAAEPGPLARYAELIPPSEWDRDPLHHEAQIHGELCDKLQAYRTQSDQHLRELPKSLAPGGQALIYAPITHEQAAVLTSDSVRTLLTARIQAEKVGEVILERASELKDPTLLAFAGRIAAAVKTESTAAARTLKAIDGMAASGAPQLTYFHVPPSTVSDQELELLKLLFSEGGARFKLRQQALAVGESQTASARELEAHSPGSGARQLIEEIVSGRPLQSMVAAGSNTGDFKPLEFEWSSGFDKSPPVIRRFSPKDLERALVRPMAELEALRSQAKEAALFGSISPLQRSTLLEVVDAAADLQAKLAPLLTAAFELATPKKHTMFGHLCVGEPGRFNPQDFGEVAGLAFDPVTLSRRYALYDAELNPAIALSRMGGTLASKLDALKRLPFPDHTPAEAEAAGPWLAKVQERLSVVSEDQRRMADAVALAHRALKDGLVPEGAARQQVDNALELAADAEKLFAKYRVVSPRAEDNYKDQVASVELMIGSVLDDVGAYLNEQDTLTRIGRYLRPSRSELTLDRGPSPELDTMRDWLVSLMGDVQGLQAEVLDLRAQLAARKP